MSNSACVLNNDAIVACQAGYNRLMNAIAAQQATVAQQQAQVTAAQNAHMVWKTEHDRRYNLMIAGRIATNTYSKGIWYGNVVYDCTTLGTSNPLSTVANSTGTSIVQSTSTGTITPMSQVTSTGMVLR